MFYTMKLSVSQNKHVEDIDLQNNSFILFLGATKVVAVQMTLLYQLKIRLVLYENALVECISIDIHVSRLGLVV